MSEVSLRIVLVCALGALAGCGQKGPLYLPDEAKQVVTRPTQTPPPDPAPQDSNSPQSPDSPPAQPADPATGVTPPQSDKDRVQKPGSAPPPR